MIKFYMTNEGVVRAETPAGMELLGMYFINDVQSIPEYFRNEFVDAIDEIKRGNRETWSITGNAHRATVTHSAVTVENVLVERAVCEVSHAEFLAVMKDWCEFVEAYKANPPPGKTPAGWLGRDEA